MPSILITGVSSGLGRALVLKAHAEGWRVFGTTRDERGARDEFPADVTLIRLEPRFAHAVSVFTERFLAEYGPPDVLVNNAAYALYSPIEEVPAEAIAEIFQVNVFAPVAIAAGLLPSMRARGSGTIVNITSLGGRFIFPFFSTYNATKHALEGFTEGLWHELRPFGIRVKAIEPGYIDTPIYDAMKARSSPAGPYAAGLRTMNAASKRVKRRTTPEAAAEEAWRAITDPSDRLRYPVAAYARGLLAIRRVTGEALFRRIMYRRLFGREER